MIKFWYAILVLIWIFLALVWNSSFEMKNFQLWCKWFGACYICSKLIVLWPWLRFIYYETKIWIGWLTWRDMETYCWIFSLLVKWGLRCEFRVFCFPLAYDFTQNTCYNLFLCMCVGFEPKQRGLRRKKPSFPN